jgi:hypothetical protein
MQAAMDDSGDTLRDLTVMSEVRDPYRLDTPAKHRVAQWFAAPERRIHVRGVFYACVSAGDVVKPDGEPFANTADNAQWLGDAASLARWLGYLPFERLVDNKNDEPVIREAPSSDPPVGSIAANTLWIEDLDADALDVYASLSDFEPRQPYRLVFFGEKTSLEDVLGPLAIEVNADLYLTGGQISDTLLHKMASDAAKDGRPLVVFTFSDCDPAGYWDMPTAIGRKLQALHDLKFPELEFTVVHAALSPEQARGLDLPSSPLKQGEGRSEIWEATYSMQQTEIDALATLQPDELKRLARAAVAPYFDAGLRRRVTLAEVSWRNRVRDEIAAVIDNDALEALKERAREALGELAAVNLDLEDMAAGIEPETPDLPEPDMEALQEAQDERRDAVLIDSRMDFVEATQRLQAHSERFARRRPK